MCDTEKTYGVRVVCNISEPSSAVGSNNCCAGFIPNNALDVLEKLLPSVSALKVKDTNEEKTSASFNKYSLPQIDNIQRDWNEEYQLLIETPVVTSFDMKERSDKLQDIVKQFNEFATKVAQVIVEEELQELAQMRSHETFTRQLPPISASESWGNYTYTCYHRKGYCNDNVDRLLQKQSKCCYK